MMALFRSLLSFVWAMSMCTVMVDLCGTKERTLVSSILKKVECCQENLNRQVYCACLNFQISRPTYWLSRE